MLVVFCENFLKIVLFFVVGGSKFLFFIKQILNSRIVFILRQRKQTLDWSDMVIRLIRLGAVGCSWATGFAGTFNGYSRREHCSLHSQGWQWVPETRVPDGFYPIRRRVWNDFSTRGYIIGQNPIPIGYGGYGCGFILPIPAYPWVRNTRRKNK